MRDLQDTEDAPASSSTERMLFGGGGWFDVGWYHQNPLCPHPPPSPLSQGRRFLRPRRTRDPEVHLRGVRSHRADPRDIHRSYTAVALLPRTTAQMLNRRSTVLEPLS